MFLEMGFQVAIIFIGKSPFHIVNDGLTGVQWGICIGFSAITFVVSFIVKLIPIQNCIEKLLESNVKENEKEEENDDIKIVSEEPDKFEITQRKSKRHGSNRLINRDGSRKNSYKLSSYKN